MELYSKGNNFELYNGNMQDLLNIIKPNSIDSIITDPPYELGFMGKSWDNSGIAFQVDTWRKCYSVLKPGAYLLAFGGSRTFHRIACAIEDAGFEIRDTIMWLYGSGFPKSMNIGKAIESKMLYGSANTQEFKNLQGTKAVADNLGFTKMQHSQGARPNDYSADGHLRTVEVDYQTAEGKQWDGWGTALKPAYEPIIVARKPCEGSCVENIIRYGVGGINIDECRIGTDVITTNGARKKPMAGDERTGKALGMFQETEALNTDHNGRYPANVILTYDDTDFNEVCGGMSDTKSVIRASYDSNRPNDIFAINRSGITPRGHDDEGSAARYYYCAKASKRDRDEGLDAFQEKQTTDGSLRCNVDTARMFGANSTLHRNTHPTVKPVDLMQYLVRLVTPPHGTVLDPFNGSGSTGKAVMYENRDRNSGYKYIGIELTAEYLSIADARIRYAACDNTPVELTDLPAEGQISIFDII